MEGYHGGMYIGVWRNSQNGTEALRPDWEWAETKRTQGDKGQEAWSLETVLWLHQPPEGHHPFFFFCWAATNGLSPLLSSHHSDVMIHRSNPGKHVLTLGHIAHSLICQGQGESESGPLGFQSGRLVVEILSVLISSKNLRPFQGGGLDMGQLNILRIHCTQHWLFFSLPWYRS